MHILKYILSICLITLPYMYVFSHGGDRHVQDMMMVIGLELDPGNRPNPQNEEAKKWCRYITNELIDNESFHYRLYEKYGISFRGPKLHRYLFHWGYDAKPWSSIIENKIIEQAPKTKYSREYLIKNIKADLLSEQKRRNRDLNSKTELLFGFAHGGKDAAYARFFAAIAYNTHLLGDYESDNSILVGLCNLEDLIGMFVIEIRNLDRKSSKEIIKGISKINNTYKDPQKKADVLMSYLKTNLPKFISKAEDGRIRSRLEKRGFRFIK